MIEYKIENDLSIEEFRMVLVNSTLGQRRPVNDPDKLQKMLEHGNLIITARENNVLIGVSRSITDFVFCTYLSDLAVDQSYQKQGIGRQLIRLTKLATPEAKLILLAAPAATGYYPKLGMMRHEYCFYLDDVNDLK
jgi:predicted N-acetyltransferase YhbS